MAIINENLSRQGMARFSTNIRVIIARLKRSHPELKVDILEKEVVARLNGLTHCEVTGFKITELAGVFLIPLNPASTETVSINQVLIVHQQTCECWSELHKIIASTPDFIEKTDYLGQLSLVLKTIRSKSKEGNLSKKRPDLAKLIERSTVTPERIINLINREAVLEQYSGPIMKATNHVRKVSFYSPNAIRRKIESCKERSKMKGFTSDLTFENAQHLFNVKHCQLTGLPLVKATKTQEDNPFGFSIDRINRFEGYNVSNLLIVAHEVNKIKSKLEWSNYTESVENLREILTQAKDIMLKRHSHDNLHNRQKPLPIDTIIENYLAKSENYKKFVFS